MAVKMIIGNSSPVFKYQNTDNNDKMAAVILRKCPPGNLVATEVILPVKLLFFLNIQLLAEKMVNTSNKNANINSLNKP